MKSLVSRLASWFAASFIVVTVVMVAATHHHLEEELYLKNWRHDYPDHPDWKLHGSYSEAEINDVLEELVEGALLYGVPLAIGAALLGYWLARKSVAPISSLNHQLQSIGARNLSQRIELPEIDKEFRELVRNINSLIERLEVSFAEMSEYAAKVAHELRTPLAIMRLKLEEAGTKLPADFSDDLQEELHQLVHVVEQSLLIAKAEQGRVKLHTSTFDLAAMVADLAEDFARLAQEDGRQVHVKAETRCFVIADRTVTRQILHNVLSNAYKHGTGDIDVALTGGDNSWILSIHNATRTQPGTAADTLGIGLRVVNTLLRLQPDVQCRRTHGEQDYLVQLEYPRAADTISA